MSTIAGEYDLLIQHLHDSAKADGSRTTKRRLIHETLKLTRQRRLARVAGNSRLTSELERLCREAISEDLKERRAKFLTEAAEAEKSTETPAMVSPTAMPG